MTLDNLIAALKEIKRDGARGDALVMYEIEPSLSRIVNKVELIPHMTVLLKR